MKKFSFDFETTQDTDEHGTVTIHAIGTGWYYPSTMYTMNGEPGEPADGGIIFTSIECFDYEDNYISGFSPDKEELEDRAWEYL